MTDTLRAVWTLDRHHATVRGCKGTFEYILLFLLSWTNKSQLTVFNSRPLWWAARQQSTAALECDLSTLRSVSLILPLSKSFGRIKMLMAYRKEISKRKAGFGRFHKERKIKVHVDPLILLFPLFFLSHFFTYVVVLRSDVHENNKPVAVYASHRIHILLASHHEILSVRMVWRVNRTLPQFKHCRPIQTGV